MIQLTRLNGHTLAINCDLIRFIESQPDTTLTLVTGDKLVVLESCADVIALAFQHRVALMQTAWPDAIPAAVAGSAARANTLAHKEA